MALQTAQGPFMSNRQISNMNIVPDTRSIGSRKIVTPNIEVVAPSAGYLCNVWHEVIGYAQRILANPATGVRSNWVEIAQNYDSPSVVRTT